MAFATRIQGDGTVVPELTDEMVDYERNKLQPDHRALLDAMLADNTIDAAELAQTDEIFESSLRAYQAANDAGDRPTALAASYAQRSAASLKYVIDKLGGAYPNTRCR